MKRGRINIRTIIKHALHSKLEPAALSHDCASTNESNRLRLRLPEEHVRDLSQPNGEVEVSGLVWAQVRALFADEPGALRAVSLASEVVTGESLVTALAAPEVAAVLDNHDLLWFAPEELDQLPY